MIMVFTHFEPMKAKTQIMLICVFVVGATIFGYYTFYPAISGIFPGLVTEQVVILESSNGNCKVDTNDIMVKSKTVTGCNLPAGTKIFITYMRGNPYAEISLP